MSDYHFYQYEPEMLLESLGKELISSTLALFNYDLANEDVITSISNARFNIAIESDVEDAEFIRDEEAFEYYREKFVMMYRRRHPNCDAADYEILEDSSCAQFPMRAHFTRRDIRIIVKCELEKVSRDKATIRGYYSK